MKNRVIYHDQIWSAGLFASLTYSRIPGHYKLSETLRMIFRPRRFTGLPAVHNLFSSCQVETAEPTTTTMTQVHGSRWFRF